MRHSGAGFAAQVAIHFKKNNLGHLRTGLVPSEGSTPNDITKFFYSPHPLKLLLPYHYTLRIKILEHEPLRDKHKL